MGYSQSAGGGGLAGAGYSLLPSPTAAMAQGYFDYANAMMQAGMQRGVVMGGHQTTLGQNAMGQNTMGQNTMGQSAMGHLSRGNSSSFNIAGSLPVANTLQSTSNPSGPVDQSVSQMSPFMSHNPTVPSTGITSFHFGPTHNNHHENRKS